MGCHFLLRKIFPIQGLNPHLLCLLFEKSWFLITVPPSLVVTDASLSNHSSRPKPLYNTFCSLLHVGYNISKGSPGILQLSIIENFKLFITENLKCIQQWGTIKLHILPSLSFYMTNLWPVFYFIYTLIHLPFVLFWSKFVNSLHLDGAVNRGGHSPPIHGFDSFLPSRKKRWSLKLPSRLCLPFFWH